MMTHKTILNPRIYDWHQQR